MQRQSFLASNVYAGQHPKPQHWAPTPKETLYPQCTILQNNYNAQPLQKVIEYKPSLWPLLVKTFRLCFKSFHQPRIQIFPKFSIFYIRPIPFIFFYQPSFCTFSTSPVRRFVSKQCCKDLYCYLKSWIIQWIIIYATSSIDIHMVRHTLQLQWFYVDFWAFAKFLLSLHK